MIDSFAVAAPSAVPCGCKMGVIKIGQRKAVIINLQIASIEMTGTSHLRRDKLKLGDKEVRRLSELERTVVIVVVVVRSSGTTSLGAWPLGRKEERKKGEGVRRKQAN